MRVKGGNTQKVMPEMKLKTENKSQRQKKKVKKEKKIQINVASQGIKVKSTTLSNSQMQQPLS